MANSFWLRKICGGPGPDVTAPTITNAVSTSVAENTQLAFMLTANEAVTWSIRTSAQNGTSVDYADFELSGSTLRWAGNGSKDYEVPDDSNTNNTYMVVVRATDTSGNTTDQLLAVTVTDLAEGLTPTVVGSFDSNAIYMVGYDSVLPCSGGTPYADGTPPYRIALKSGSAALPDGLVATVDMDGSVRLSGVVSETAGTYTGTLVVTDNNATSTEVPFSLTVPQMPSTLTIQFGSKTLDSYGGHTLGNARGTTLSITAGNGLNHWQIVETNGESRLAPNGAGGAGTAGPTYSGPYSITVSNGTESCVVTINMVANKAHFRGNTSDALNSWELRTYLSSTSWVALNDSLVMRNGSMEDNTGNSITPPTPTGGWAGSTDFITITSEWEDLSYNSEGRPNRAHGGRIPTIRINTAGNVRIPWLFDKIHFEYTYATPNDGTTQLIYNTARSFGMSATNCRFSCASNVTTPRNVAAMELRSSATVAAKFENNTVITGGKGVTIMSNHTTYTSERPTGTRVVGNDFINGRRDQIRINGDDGSYIGATLEVVEDNLMLHPLLDTGGDHQDCIQHVGHKNGATAIVPAGSYCDNILITDGTDPAYPQGIYLDDTVGTARLGDLTIERNIIIGGLNNQIWLMLCNNPTVRFNTVIAPLNKSANGHIPTILAQTDAGQTGVDATVQYNIANAINMSAQTGTVVNSQNKTVSISQSPYDAMFAGYFNGPVNRIQAKACVIPLEDGTAKNADGTYAGVYFPDGSLNDGTVY